MAGVARAASPRSGRDGAFFWAFGFRSLGARGAATSGGTGGGGGANFDQPRIETHVGVAKADLRFADVLVIEAGPSAGSAPRVETFSFKSRDFLGLDGAALAAQVVADARAALKYYGETLNIRRPGLEQTAQIKRVRLIYEETFKPLEPDALERAVNRAESRAKGVEVLFQ